MENYRRTRHACYYTYLGASAIFALPPLLFVTFREMYDVSYTLLGTLVLVNFCTQLFIDLMFTLFTRFFSVAKCIRTMPLIISVGFLVYALVPKFFPQYTYWGLVAGTVIFAVAGGLCEVLLSPLVAAIPSDTPDRDMSLLHSLYAYGVVMVIVVSTVFFEIFGRENWIYLTLFWAIMPLISFVMFMTSPIPDVKVSQGAGAKNSKDRKFIIALCAVCIFLGGASENSMTNWISGFIEKALNVSKAFGDVVGMTSFAILLGLGRSLYAKYGKNISKVLLFGMIGASVCYLVAGLAPYAVLSMIACVFTGLCTSMLWPGTLIMMEEKLPNIGVTAYALMAAGGDLGSSIAPQMVGVVVDIVSSSNWAAVTAPLMSLTTEQLGMKVAMLMSSAFPIMGILLLMFMNRYFKKKENVHISTSR